MPFILTNLRSDVRFLIFNDSTNTQYSDTDLDRNVNRWYHTGVAWILTANGEWQVNGEIATTDINDGQREYILPSDILKLNEVYIKTTDTQVDYIKAKQRDANVREDEGESSSYHPSPTEYDLLDNSIFIYIPEDEITDVEDGLKIHYQSNITELTTNDAPNLAEPFKRLLSYGAAYDYCMANEMWNKCKVLENNIAVIKEDMLEFYASRSTTKPVIMEASEENLF